MSEQQPCSDCEKLRESLQWFFDRLEDQTLVRNTSNDADSGWAIKQLRFVSALKQAQDALAQPCQQPASIESGEWTVKETDYTTHLDFGGSKYLSMSKDFAGLLYEVADAHNATLRRQSAPVEAWRDLHPNEKPQNGDRWTGHVKVWQRRVTQGEQS